MKTIGIVTSGGDAPGMNAAIRAATRIAYSRKLEVLGFERGWEGVINGVHRQLTPRSVGGIIQLGGTILHTSRCPEFKESKSVKKAAQQLTENNVEGLIVIGGDGSLRAAHELTQETDAVIVVIPASIDNDVSGSDETIGFDTAVNTAVAEIDKIRDTALSMDRIFVVEVMGRTRGFIASTVGITVGAEVILVPEVKLNIQQVLKAMKNNIAKGKRSGIIVAAEGIGDTRKLAETIENETRRETKLSIVGYAQRGGSPTARSRLLASLFAEKAVQLISEGKRGLAVGLHRGEITSFSIEKSCKTRKPLDMELLQLAQTLAV